MAGYMPARADFVEVRLFLLSLFYICYWMWDQQTRACMPLPIGLYSSLRSHWQDDRADWLNQGFNCRGGAAGLQSSEQATRVSPGCKAAAATRCPLWTALTQTDSMSWIGCLAEGVRFSMLLFHLPWRSRQEPDPKVSWKAALFSVFLAVGPGPQFLLQNKLLYIEGWIPP